MMCELATHGRMIESAVDETLFDITWNSDGFP